MNRILPRIFLFACAAAAAGQTTPPVQQTVVVIGNAAPVTQGESPRSVVVMDTQRTPLAFATVEDQLRTDPSTFIEQRGAGGAQDDISIRGASFEQTLVLVNGLRINDAQTSHHNLDLPVPTDGFSEVEVLHGAGSTLYGSDAIGGVVDFVTAEPEKSSVRLRARGGSFGENEEAARVAYAGHRWSELAAGSRNFSTGFMADRDYRNENGSTETRWKSALGATDILLAGSDRAFGANQFYGPYNSWERTKGWFASARQELGKKDEAAFGYRRHTDNFILLRDDPAFYANHHVDTSWQGVVRRHDAIGRLATVYTGLEADGDAIDSNNLGRHARNRGAGYADVDLRFRSRANLSAGLREEILSGGARLVWSPDLAGSLRVGAGVKLRAAGGYGFRLPTYTDLYYSDPSTKGNPLLKPESAWSGEAGADWYAGTRSAASLTAFYSRQHDAIDYVRANAASQWQAVNLNGLRFAGVEGWWQWMPTAHQQVKLGWTGLWGAQGALHGLESEYVFNDPVNNASLEWQGTIRQECFVHTRLQVAQRYQQDAYPVWDVDASRARGRLRPWMRAANLSNTGYEEIAGVRMPGRSFTAGIEIELGAAGR